MKILMITHDCQRAAAGSITERRCERCSAEWAEVRELPYQIPQNRWPKIWDAVVVRAGTSRTGLHEATIRPEAGFLPTRPTRDPARAAASVLPGPIELVPTEFADRPWATWTVDEPFKHIVAAVPAGGQSPHKPEIKPTLECGLCYRDRLEATGLRQGHLFVALLHTNLCHRLSADGQYCFTPSVEHPVPCQRCSRWPWDHPAPTRDGEIHGYVPAGGKPLSALAHTFEGHYSPRIRSPHQEGASRLYFEPQYDKIDPEDRGAVWRDGDTIRIFNHRIAPAQEVEVTWRGNIGTISAKADVLVTSPDHPDETLRLGDGTYEWYHPWPSRDGRD